MQWTIFFLLNRKTGFLPFPPLAIDLYLLNPPVGTENNVSLFFFSPSPLSGESDEVFFFFSSLFSS